MNLKKIYGLSLRIKGVNKSLCIRPVSYSNFYHRLLSTKPVELSFFEFHPEEKIHSPTPVVILHGFLGSKQNWRGLGKAIAKKSRKRVFVLDARNHGDSPHSDYFSYPLMSEDVKYFLNSQNIKKAVLVGHSMGGRTAMKLALTEKEMVSKLVAVDVSPINLPESSLSAIPSYMKVMKEAVALVPDVGIVHARKLIDNHLSKTIPEAPIRHFLLTNLFEKDKKILWKPNIDVLQRTFKNEIRDTSDFSGYFMEETLFICGEKSDYVKEDDYPVIKQMFPKAEFIVVPGAGHWVHSEKPVEFLEALCYFL